MSGATRPREAEPAGTVNGVLFGEEDAAAYAGQRHSLRQERSFQLVACTENGTGISTHANPALTLSEARATAL